MKRIFISGAAGFIGFNLSLALKKQNNFVIGIDNFNDYYDVNLKLQREKILNQNGIKIIHADLDDKILEEEIEKNQITHFVNLAAQAGVRYSFENPQAYIHSNISGFLNVLEALKKHKNVKLVFASSSSVYGLNEKLPFSEKDQTDKQANLYGSTKKANESMAFAYHNLYNIDMLGIRYFTVYGPWGRPDMAYFKFTKSILEKKPIEIFDPNMKRDFTYIDDAIDGTIKALDYCKGFEIFNIGSNNPINIEDFIKTIEARLNKKAIKKYSSIFKGEMGITYADISKSEKLLGFYPSTSIEYGIEKFITWYKDYFR